MKSGSVVLTPMQQADGQRKNRPAPVLCAMRPFGDLLLCGINTQLRLEVADFDELSIQTMKIFARRVSQQNLSFASVTSRPYRQQNQRRDW